MKASINLNQRAHRKTAELAARRAGQRWCADRVDNTFFFGTESRNGRAFALFYGYPDWRYGSSDRIASPLLRLG